MDHRSLERVEIRDAVRAIVFGTLAGTVVFVFVAVRDAGSVADLRALESGELPVPAFLWGLGAALFVQFVYLVIVVIERRVDLRDLGVAIEPIDVVIAIGLLLLLWAGDYVLLAWILEPLGFGTADVAESQIPSAIARSTEQQVLAFLLLTVVAAPVVEEVLYRGVMLRALENRFGIGAAIAASSLVFGLAHIVTFSSEDVPIVVVATWAGVLWAGSAVLTRRLAAGTLAHVWNNLAAGLVVTAI